MCADVGRGDSKDYSAFHVIDVETVEQVAEYKGRIPTKDFFQTNFSSKIFNQKVMSLFDEVIRNYKSSER